MRTVVFLPKYQDIRMVPFNKSPLGERQQEMLPQLKVE